MCVKEKCRSPHGERGLKCIFAGLVTRLPVALLTESVDWNDETVTVDFNHFESRSPHGERGLKLQLCRICHHRTRGSLSSRRAWIEIVDATSDVEIVDCRSPHGERGLKSTPTHFEPDNYVALLTESVDWNKNVWLRWKLKESRSPHGERGLKFGCDTTNTRKEDVALLTESVDWNWNGRYCYRW